MIFNLTSNDKQNSKTINNELDTQLEIHISFNKILFNLPLNPTDSEIEENMAEPAGITSIFLIVLILFIQP